MIIRRNNMKKYKVLFCDLDGTLIDTLSGETFPKGVWDMKLKFDVLDAIKQLNPDYVFIVSNQGGIEKGFVNEESFITKQNYITTSIAEYLNMPKSCVKAEYCRFNDPNNPFRKPNTSMLVAFSSWIKDIDDSEILMIGDASGLKGQYSDSDKMTAENFGIDYMDVSEFVKVMTKEE